MLYTWVYKTSHIKKKKASFQESNHQPSTKLYYWNNNKVIHFNNLQPN